VSSLDEADAYICGQLEACGYTVEGKPYSVQAFRCDASKPKAHQYAAPASDDPWHKVRNLVCRRTGDGLSSELVYLAAHKDSQSWVDSPGALDNAVGTVALMEIARHLADALLARTVRFLFCNEEHTPWTSACEAQEARNRGDQIHAMLNLDGLTGRPQVDIDASRHTLVTGYTHGRGRELAEAMGSIVERYRLPLEHRVAQREFPNDDDGSFVKAGFDAAIIAIGSCPYGDPAYHTEDDTPDRVDIELLRLSVMACLAWTLEQAV
jgi:Zn-dependent M28 family amino/carboxypeptidase